MKLKKSYFSVEPDMVTSEGNNKLITFDVEEVKLKNEAMGEGGKATETTQYAAYCVRVDEPVTRDRIIAAIITAAYPMDEMQAVQNNYMFDPSDEEHKAEYNAMQQWRTHAKEIASKVMNPLGEAKS